MKKIVVFIVTIVLFLGETQGALDSEISSRDKTHDPLIIVLDPGHDKDHGGAR